MFYIIEQGARIRTPLESLLKQRNVNPISETAATHAISAELPNIANKNDHVKPLKAYQESAEPKQTPRHRARFAEELMTHPVISVTADYPLKSSIVLLQKHNFHHLPIVDENKKLKGIVSDRDIMRYRLQHPNSPLETITTGEVMTQRVISAALTTEIRAIADVLCQRNFSAMPITDEQQRVVGMLSRSDILKALVLEAPLEIWI